MIKAVLFDLDGVLLDSHEWIYGAFRHSMQKHGLNVTDEEIHNRAGGNTLEICYQKLTGLKDTDGFVRDHREFQQQNLHLMKIFPGAREILQMLKENCVSVAIVSNRTKSIPPALERFKLMQFIDAVVTASDVANPKPHGDHASKALEVLGAKPGEAIMVGDMLEDLHSAKSSGCKTIAVLYGFGKREELLAEKPDYSVENIRGLHTLLLRLVH